MRAAGIVWGALAVAAAACGPKTFDPPAEGERVLEASMAFSPAAFDTIDWPDRSRMLVTGAAIYGADCRDCHGPEGRGGTAYAEEHRIDPPSLVREDWPFEGDLDAVRQVVFTGHVGGMPTHGIAGLTPRQIDAVSRYLVEQLRPEVSGR